VWGFTAERGVIARSTMGAAVVEFLDFSGSGLNLVLFEWRFESSPLRGTQSFKFGGEDNTYAGLLLQGNVTSGRFLLCVPYWFLAPGFAVLSVVLWPEKSLQFSLRTLLIATALIAMLLGAIVYTVR
jgi:hypothetical protein